MNHSAVAVAGELNANIDCSHSHRLVLALSGVLVWKPLSLSYQDVIVLPLHPSSASHTCFAPWGSSGAPSLDFALVPIFPQTLLWLS